MKPWVLLLAVVLTLAGPLRAGERVVLEEIVARVNNEILTLAKLEHSRRLLRRELSERHTGAELERKVQEGEADLLRDLIDQTLLVQRGTDLGLSVEADVIKRLDRMRQDMGLPTLEEFERAVAAQGLVFEDFRQQLRDQFLTQQVIQREVAGRVLVDSEQVRQYYLQHRQELMQPERIRLREILVSTQGYDSTALPARQERVQEVLEKIRRGEKFEDLARTYSDAPTAADGGDLGYFEPEKLAPEVREVVAKLRESGVSDPLHTSQGYLILQLAEHIPAGLPPFEKIEGELRQKLYFDQVQPALREYLSNLRRDAFVYVKPAYVDSGAVKEAPKPLRRGRRRRPRRD